MIFLLTHLINFWKSYHPPWPNFSTRQNISHQIGTVVGKTAQIEFLALQFHDVRAFLNAVPKHSGLACLFFQFFGGRNHLKIEEIRQKKVNPKSTEINPKSTEIDPKVPEINPESRTYKAQCV